MFGDNGVDLFLELFLLSSKQSDDFLFFLCVFEEDFFLGLLESSLINYILSIFLLKITN